MALLGMAGHPAGSASAAHMGGQGMPPGMPGMGGGGIASGMGQLSMDAKSTTRYILHTLPYIYKHICKSFFSHWTPLFWWEKFQAFGYDILLELDRVGHCREPHVFSFLICAFVSEL